ncbi:MAG: sodium:solute symporter [Flammeovirgaceae bacterium]|nr:sodium:solute symporter [Flammeovirgaceae bacterium]MBE62113.1 sodium:solute symporter [Flammeovirgaceae bacterium]HCX24310.1 sodium:solute symporter [Cytophagales bacterium]|tara:strand:+ start:2904 stop:4340 length:1437 start_codon:yes stop_codon:yes gene_type:complete
MSPVIVGSIVFGYFLVLITISWLTSRNSSDGDFYNANRQSPWYLVAFGMIGASLSGVTFISVPGEVGNSNFYYFQVVLGYLVGYWVIAKLLLPLYYKLNLVSIYTYLEQRFGYWAYKSGAFFFLLSRIIGSSFRLFLVAGVLQISFFDAFDLPFWVSVLVTIVLIWVYTFRGGIKTIVWTDTLQTAFMLAAVVISIFFIKDELNWSWNELTTNVTSDSRFTLFNWDWQSGKNFFKQFISGAFIAIVMTGLDQDMMQKNLTCRTLSDAQKNVFWFCIILVIANFLFLSLGLLQFQFAEHIGMTIPARTDYLFPELAINHFPTFGAVIFLLGITAAAYSSADSALTAMTTSFCVDFLGFTPANYHEKKTLRKVVHLAFSFVLFFVILIFQAINDQSVITAVFVAAGYTYGPLLGMFALGMFTKIKVKDHLVPVVTILSPILSYIININSEAWLGGYKFGFEILILNGLLTFIGLVIIRKS